MKEKKVTGIIVKILIFILSLTVLFFLLHHIGFDKVSESFAKVGIYGASVLILLGLVESTLDAVALTFATPERLSFVRSFSSTGFGSLLNLVVPFEGGEVVKVGLVGKEIGVSSAIRGIVLWNYTFNLTKASSLVAVLIISLFIGRDYSMDNFLIVFAAAILGFIPFFGMMILIRSNISVKLVKLLKFLGKKNSDDLLRKAEDLGRSLKQFKKERPGDYRAMFFIQFFARFISWITFPICAYFAGFDYSLSTLSLAYCAVTLSGYVVSLIPAKVGVAEGAGFLMFSFLGLDGGAGLLITFIMRIKAAIVMGIASLFTVAK